MRDQCSDTEVTCISSMRDYNIPYTMNCTNITIIAENALGILEHTVNLTSPGEFVFSGHCQFTFYSGMYEPTTDMFIIR